MQKNIRIFVNNKLIEINKYSSIYNLKSKIATILFEDAEPGEGPDRRRVWRVRKNSRGADFGF